MTANTILADINEIYLGIYLNGGKSYDAEADRQLKIRVKQATLNEVRDQSEKALVMANEVMRWAKAHKYLGEVKTIYWTSRPGVLQSVMGTNVDSKKNPADILIKFSDGKFLGISAKSTKTNSDRGFKNLGIGTIESDLNIDLKNEVKKTEDSAIKKFNLPTNAAERKAKIRASPELQKQTQALGSALLMSIRNKLFKKLKGMKNDDIRKYIRNSWMDSNAKLFPHYIKVTGMGKSYPYSAKIDVPLDSEKFKALTSGTIKIEIIGNESIGIKVGTKKILKMRAKFESEKLASCVKFSGDSW
jgi:hypothetical protein